MNMNQTGPDLALVRRLSRPGDVHGWLDLGPGVCLGRRPDGRVCQRGVIQAAMVVIDDPSARAEDNPGGRGNDRPDGTPMRHARDYLDYFAPAAGEFLRASSYGRCDMAVTLVEAATPTGVFRLSGDRAATYPNLRGGDVNAYVLEALDLARDALHRAGDRFDVLYVVAAENFEAISYGPTDVRGDKLWALGLHRYGALVRIGQDSYNKFKKKAFIHELGHDLGLPDLYVDGDGCQRDAFSGKIDAYPAVGHWGMMSQINSPSHDFLAWEKFQLGWLDDCQVAVAPGEGRATYELTASSVPGGLKLILIPGPRPGVAYAVEYKRAAGVEVAPIKEPHKPPLLFEGLYICRVDGANRTMESPVTTVNLFPAPTPQEQIESSLDTLARSVLGPRSGVFVFEDPAAGLTLSITPQGALPGDPAAPLAVAVERRAPAPAERTPVLWDAAFLDLDTLECRTSFDLRGINHRRVKVCRGGRSLGPADIDHIGPRTLRVRLAPGTLQSAGDMAGVTLYTEAFSFYAASAPVPVAPAAVQAGPVIQAHRQGDSLVLRADLDLSALEPRHFRLTRTDGACLPPRAYTVSFEDGGRTATLAAHLPQDMADVTAVQAAMASNYNPARAERRQMYFGAEPSGIVLRAASPAVTLGGR